MTHANATMSDSDKENKRAHNRIYITTIIGIWALFSVFFLGGEVAMFTIFETFANHVSSCLFTFLHVSLFPAVDITILHKQQVLFIALSDNVVFSGNFYNRDIFERNFIPNVSCLLKFLLWISS